MGTSFTDRARKEYYQELVKNRFVMSSAPPLYDDYRNNHAEFLSKSAIEEFFKKALSSAPIATALPEAETTHSVHFDSPRQKASHTTIIHNYGNNNSNNDIYFWLLWLFGGNQAAPVAQNNTQTNNTNSNKSDFVAFMLILIICVAVVIPTAISAYYLTSELLSNLERLWYNEGYIRAGFGLANIVISLILATYATNALLSHFITGLCISAGFFSNPIGWAFLTLGLITVTVAGLINLLVQEGIYAISAVCNRDALCPEDAGRFTANEADLLRSIDRDKVQNVITAIHHDMEPRGFGGWRYSPFFRLKCLGNQGSSEKLHAIRRLRAEGEVDYQTTVAADTSLYFNTAMLKNH